MSESPIPPLSRSRFLRVLGLGTAGFAASQSFILPSTAAASALSRLEKAVSIGLIADLHQDIMHDGESRLDAFLKAMSRIEPDAIMQLGDFAYPDLKKNGGVIGKFNKAHRNALHVIGNHDTDSGHTVKQCLEVWGMSSRFYRCDIGGLRLIVLDGNDKGSPAHKGGYASYVGKEQVDWLKNELASFDGPMVIVSHQPLAGSSAVDNAKELQSIISGHSDKVVLCMNGHTHIDDLLRVGGVSYFHVNSASYKWVGSKFEHESYPAEIHKKFPWIGSTCPYRDCLFTSITFDPASASVRVMGVESAWVGKSPAQLGDDHHSDITNGEEIAPRIRSRMIEMVRR